MNNMTSLTKPKTSFRSQFLNSHECFRLVLVPLYSKNIFRLYCIILKRASTTTLNLNPIVCSVYPAQKAQVWQWEPRRPRHCNHKSKHSWLINHLRLCRTDQMPSEALMSSWSYLDIQWIIIIKFSLQS